MDEKLKSSSKEESIAQAYAAYMLALATRKHGPDKPDISCAEQRSTWQISAIKQKAE